MTSLKRWAAAYAVAGLDGYERAVLVALAYHAGSDDLIAWPSIELLAKKTAFSEDTCRRAIHRLIDRGVIAAESSSGRRTNKYRLLALQPLPAASVEPSPPATVAVSNPSCQQRQPSLLASQPSLPATRTGKNRERTGGGGNKRGTPVPETFAITDELRSWAIRVGVPAQDIESETAAFLDHHRARGSVFKCWPSAWRTWMRRVPKYRGAPSRQHENARRARAIGYASEEVS